MLAKYGSIQSLIKKEIKPLYIITGPDQFLLNAAAILIKNGWRNRGEYDEKIIDLSQNEWELVFSQANNFSLFFDLTLLDIRYNKKTMDAVGNRSIAHYLDNYNEKCLIIIRAPFLTGKQLLSLAKHENVCIIQANSFNANELENWIKSELENKKIMHEKSVPHLIYQFSQNNMLAAAQAIEKLNLINEPDKVFSEKCILGYLTNQAEYPIYELSNACLSSDSLKCISILRKISADKGEPVYILWIISQEIRLLMQLNQLLSENISLNTACGKLKIWPQKISLYSIASKRLSMEHLQKLISQCAQLDELIKSNKSTYTWDKLEQLALLLCLGWKL